MNKKILNFCNVYNTLLDEIMQEYSSLEQEDELKEKINALEKYAVNFVRQEKDSLSDEDIMEILKLLKIETNKVIIIEMLSNESNVIKYIPQIEDDYRLKKISKTLSDDNKVLCINKINYISDKIEVLVSIRNRDVVSLFLLDNPSMKKEIVKYIGKNKYNMKRLWEFVKMAGLEEEVIPYILYDSKYEIIDDMTEEMKKDVERYLGKSLPEDIKTLSIYERVGLDFEALNESVITSEEQLQLDDIQKRYFNYISILYNVESKRKFHIKDFMGTMSPTLSHDSKEIKTWGDLVCGLKRMKENIAHSYSEKSLLDNNVEGIENFKLRIINGKCYVSGNGNHRLTFFKARYLSDIKRANGDQQRLSEIEEKYVLEASYVKELPNNLEELIGISILGIIKDIQDDKFEITEVTENGEKSGYEIHDENGTIILSDLEALNKYLMLKIHQLEGDKEMYEKFNSKIMQFRDVENGKYLEIFEHITGISLEGKEKQSLNMQEIIANALHSSNAVTIEDVRAAEMVKDNIRNLPNNEKKFEKE